MSDADYGSPQPVQHVVVHTQPSNGMGTAGFVISLVGLLLFCGLLSPLGLIFSLIGLGKEPRGLAIAGTVIGLIGSIWLPLVGLALIGTVVGLGAVADEPGSNIKTGISIAEAHGVIEQHSGAGGALPSAAEGNRLIAGIVDAWGTALRYEPGDERYVIRSAGPDRVFGTADDIPP